MQINTHFAASNYYVQQAENHDKLADQFKHLGHEIKKTFNELVATTESDLEQLQSDVQTWLKERKKQAHYKYIETKKSLEAQAEKTKVAIDDLKSDLENKREKMDEKTRKKTKEKIENLSNWLDDLQKKIDS